MEIALSRSGAAVHDAPRDAACEADKRPAEPEPLAREPSAPPEVAQPQPPASPVNAARGESIRRLARAVGKRLSTLAIFALAIVVSLITWQHYVTAPWTRNGTVRVQV